MDETGLSLLDQSVIKKGKGAHRVCRWINSCKPKKKKSKWFSNGYLCVLFKKANYGAQLGSFLFAFITKSVFPWNFCVCYTKREILPHLFPPYLWLERSLICSQKHLCVPPFNIWLTNNVSIWSRGGKARKHARVFVHLCLVPFPFPFLPPPGSAWFWQ